MELALAPSTLKRLCKSGLRGVFGKSPDEIAAELRGDAEVVSFDVFDTLVARSCKAPEDVFDLVEKRFNALHLGMKVEGFRARRIAAERRARAVVRAEEVTVFEIYAMFDDGLRDAAPMLLALELDAELRTCRANADMKPLFNAALESGKRVVIASDMYLPESVVEAILANCGYEGHERLYVSSEARKTKGTGALFELMASDLDVPFRRILHIGDNPISDWMAPRRLGCSSCLCDAKRNGKRIERTVGHSPEATQDQSANSSGPTIDVLLATYNGEKYLSEQIRSIQTQTFQNWRLLISDDGSADGTLDIIAEFAESDSRIERVERDAAGMGSMGNFLHLLSLSDADYVMFCDQDDVWLPDKIERTLDVMLAREGVAGNLPVLVFTDLTVVDSRLNVIAPSFEEYERHDPSRTSLYQLMVQNVACGCTMLLNRSLADLCVMGYHAGCKRALYHDWFVALVAAAFGEVEYLDSATMLYRQHGDNSVGAPAFKLRERLNAQAVIEERWRGTIDQAANFLALYRHMLTADQVRRIERFVSLADERNLARAITRLFQSGCWKSRSRRVAQFELTRRLVRDNRRRTRTSTKDS